MRFIQGGLCGDFVPPCGENWGVCCNDTTFICEEDTFEIDCIAAGGRFLPAPATCDDFIPSCEYSGCCLPPDNTCAMLITSECLAKGGGQSLQAGVFGDNRQGSGFVLTALAAFVRLVDRLNDAIGRGIAWLTLAMVLITFAVVVLRYVYSIGWVWMQESYVWLHGIAEFAPAASASPAAGRSGDGGLLDRAIHGELVPLM